MCLYYPGGLITSQRSPGRVPARCCFAVVFFVVVDTINYRQTMWWAVWELLVPVLLSSRKVLVQVLGDHRGPIIFKSLSSSSSSKVQVLENFSGLSRLTYAKYQLSTIVLHLKWLSDEWMTYLPLCPDQVQVHVDLTVLPHSSVIVLEESPCPRGSSRTNFQVFVLVLVLESQVLDNNTG